MITDSCYKKFYVINRSHNIPFGKCNISLMTWQSNNTILSQRCTFIQQEKTDLRVRITALSSETGHLNVFFFQGRQTVSNM